MNTSRRSLLRAALLLVATLPAPRAAQSRTVKIGVQIPLSGERANVGKTMQNALQMAVDSVNSRVGRQGLKFELEWVDDESTNDGAVKALDKIAHDPQIVAIIGEINSPLVLASRPVVEREGIPYLTGGTSPRTTEQTQWIFRAGASDALLTNLIARHVMEQMKAKIVAVLHDRTGVHNNRADILVQALHDKFSIAPAVTAAWSPGDRNFSAQLQQVKSKNAQVVVALGETGEAGPFLTQVKSTGLEARVVAHRDFGVKSALDDAGPAAEGTLIFTEFAPELQDRQTQTWAAAYRKRFGADANVIAAQYYDAMLLLAEAARTGSPTRAGIKSGLEQLKAFKGVMADYTFDTSRNGVHRFFVAKVAGGRLTLVTVLKEEL
jgi:branched-chain amino acid transport system substrate-binding protein